LAYSRLDELCDLYDDVFSSPPFFWRDGESLLHRQRLSSMLSEPTFGIAVAYRGNTLVGFAYGLTLPADTRRWSSLSSPMPAETAAEWPDRTFELVDYAVRSTHRGRGIGRSLHNGLLASRPEERATLTVQPVALATKRMYEHWGWRHVGQMEPGPTAPAPVFDVYLRDTLTDLR